MIQTSARRSAFRFLLGACLLVCAGAAHAQTGVTGTDPVPKGCPGCIATPPSSSTARTSPVSSGGAVTQAVLILLGLA